MCVYGGTVGEDSMGISDAPVFIVGDHDILFVENNGTQAIPLVEITVPPASSCNVTARALKL